MPQFHDILIRFVQGHFPMDDARAKEISSIFHEQHFLKNDLLIHQNKISDHYYFLCAGYVRSYTHNWQGEEVTLQLISPNKVVCELASFFKRIPSQSNFQALTDCIALRVSFADIQKAFHAMPEFREFGRSMLVNAFVEMQQRNIGFIQETAEQRYANLVEKQPDLLQHVPLKYLASYLGITDSSLSRIRKESGKRA
ncbi:MAG: Crp/Fnr family transcriptional regulator [Bacteroidia bacterium]